MSNQIKNQRGLTLLEIAISMAILSIALVALANFFPIGLKASRRASNFSEAGILAQRVIENIKRAASIYDGGVAGDRGEYDPADPWKMSNDNCIGYYELLNTGVGGPPYFFPFDDDDLADSSWVGPGLYKYEYDYTNMDVYVKVEDHHSVNRELMQKVYVAVEWKEGERVRADTFITYISNPFYEKYK